MRDLIDNRYNMVIYEQECFSLEDMDVECVGGVMSGGWKVISKLIISYNVCT